VRDENDGNDGGDDDGFAILQSTQSGDIKNYFRGTPGPKTLWNLPRPELERRRAALYAAWRRRRRSRRLSWQNISSLLAIPLVGATAWFAFPLALKEPLTGWAIFAASVLLLLGLGALNRRHLARCNADCAELAKHIDAIDKVLRERVD
jgi:hypothetical protein